MRIIAYISLIILLLLSSQCNRTNSDDKNAIGNNLTNEYAHYDISLKIDPHKSFIQVNGKLTIPSNQINGEEIVFFLDSGMQIQKFALNNSIAFAKDSITQNLKYMPVASKLRSNKSLKLNKDLNKFTFSYSGTLSELPGYFANVVSSDWVEMGLYYPWFPYSESIKHFTFKLNIHIDKSYTTFGLGNSYTKDSIQIIECTVPTNDMVVCASKNVIINSWKTEKNRLNLYHHALNDSVVNKLQSDLSAIVSQLNNYFGDDERTVNVILSKRERGGGYGRIGGMFLSGFKPEKYYSSNENYSRYFAHEFSHIWWHKADANTWEDWLNEGFAEFTALIVVRNLFGDTAFEERIQAKQTAIANTSPIWGFDRSNSSSKEAMKNAELLLYSKAPVLLYELENKIGNEQFIRLSNVLISRKVNNTKDFLLILRSIEGDETSKWFENLLKTF